MSSASVSVAGLRALAIPEAVFESLVRHATGTAPEECCGILLGAVAKAGRVRVERAIPADNVEEMRRDRTYRIAPLAILAAARRARAEGLEIVGYYHSHPSGSARPSELDRAGAWPDTSYVILGLRQGMPATARSWRLNPGGEFVEEEFDRG